MINSFFIKIADVTVEMQARSLYSKYFCKDFVIDGDQKPDIRAFVSEETLNSPSFDDDEGRMSPPAYENLCLYREIAERLPAFDRFVFHGAAVSADGKGIVFTAPSGTGKSTHISLWKKVYKERISVINGDKPIIGIKDGRFVVFSSPWCGKEGWHTNTEAPLSALCFLNRGKENKIERIAQKDCLEIFLKQIYLSHDSEAKLKTLELADKLASEVPFYMLYCNISEEAARLSFEAMISEE